MQGTISFLIEYCIVNIIPKIILGITVYLLWTKIGTMTDDIKRGLSLYNGTPTNGNETWEQTYNSYISNPFRMKIILRGSLELSMVLFGLMLIWAGPLDAYLPILFVFFVLGLFSMLRWNLPSLDINTDIQNSEVSDS